LFIYVIFVVFVISDNKVMNIDNIKQLLKKYNLSPNFTYGQNFLIDDDVLNNIVNTAKVTSIDQILEIGPGIGNLTEKLLATGAKVFSIEKDPKFLPIFKALQKKYPNFEFTIEDFLNFDLLAFSNNLPQVAGRYKAVANIPYYITGKILRKFFNAAKKPAEIVLLTQKEVAKNVIAKAGHMSLLGISVQLYGKPEIIKIVNRESFYPAPKVDSAIIKIEIFKKQKYKISEEQKFFKVVKACFLGKRKQIHNTLVNNLRLEKQQVEEILKKLNINFKSRPQELSVEDWIKLSDMIDRNNRD